MSSVDSNADNKVLTLSEVRELAEDKNKCIIIIDNNVYDLTRFLKEHRGGEEALKVQHGRDATKAFEDVGHSSDAREQMKAYKIAKLDSVKRTVTNEQCGGEVQIHALSIAPRQPIYSCVKFLDDPKRVHSIPSDISTQDLINRFNDGTAGGHLKYIGYKSDMNKSTKERKRSAISQNKREKKYRIKTKATSTVNDVFREKNISTSMEQNQQRAMSTTEIDLESVLQVRRRRLSVTAPQASPDAYRYTDVIILKVEKPNDILKEDARCDYHVLTDIFQKYTSHIKIHHEDPEMVKNHDRLSGKLYTTVELPTMSFIEILEILHKHYFSIVANATNFGSTTKIQEFILLRNRDSFDASRPLPTIDTKAH
ncbi:unnamed protein product [Rotaria socialis]